jgi:oligopeptide transport system substrate-binding protein
MQRMLGSARWLMMLMVLAMVAAACGGGEGDDVVADDPVDEVVDGDTEGDEDDEEPATEDDATEDDGAGEGGTGGSFTIRGCEPQFLNTTDARDTCGGMVLRQLFSPLVDTDPETGEPELFVAESVESDDNTVWTITFGDQWTFHDGEPVTAQSYVDAWNAVAQPESGNSFFFSRFEGFDEVQDGSAETMSGVEAIDDTTIQVTLTEPFAPFVAQLSDTSFYPLPTAFFDDPEAFQDAPIGNGRYQMSGTWERNVQIALARYEDWPGDTPGNADEITYVLYDDLNTAYLDALAGNLDVMDSIPPENLVTADTDFGDNVIRTTTSTFTYLGYPMNQPEFGENLELRQALSLAIDRQAIIDTIFDGTLTAANAVIPPTLTAHREDASEFTTYDPERAQELFEEAGGFDGTMTMYFNSGAGHDTWVEAVANQWREVLGIEDIQFESLEFAQYLDLLDAGEVEGPFRLGWVTIYSSPQYTLEDLYTSTGGSNNFNYSNPEFDEALAEANRTPVEDADAAYQAAEDILLEDLPLIPMWFGLQVTVHNDTVSNVVVGGDTYVRAELIEVNS